MDGLLNSPTFFTAAILALSLLNAMLLGWLALVVLLNAYRVTWGVLLTDAALVLGSLFFLAQATIAGAGMHQLLVTMHLQWPMGWFIGLLLALAWYASILWYTGLMTRGAAERLGGAVVLDDTRAPGTGAPTRRHRVLLPLMLAVFVGMVGLAFAAMPYPWIKEPNATQLFSGPHVGGMPLLAVLYPLFILACVGLAVDGLLHTRGAGPIEELAHRRARPWLLATSGALLVVAAIIGTMMLIAARAPAESVGDEAAVLELLMIWADVLVSGAVAVAVLCLGQAIVNYEIFTGKALPRRGLRAQWYGAIFLSGMYSGAAAWAVAVEEKPFYGLLVATVLVVIFYALYNWRAYAERDRSMRQLRPALRGPAVFEMLRQEADEGRGPRPSDTPPWVTKPFAALCEQTLAAEVAYLIPVGPLASLAGPPLAYPAGDTPPTELAALIAASGHAEAPALVLDPEQYGGALWGLPLWTERGLVGLLLLGEKRGLELYSQEEMEIARTSAARLIDSIACGRLAQRLMRLQRERLAETQVADRRTRRVLHDEVLPRLHAAMLAMGGGQPEVVRELAAVHGQLSGLLRELPAAVNETLGRAGLIGALRQLLDDELPEAFEAVTWDVSDDAEQRLRGLPPLTAEVVYYAAREAFRNAARHGRAGDAARPLGLTVRATPAALVIEDDGRGFGTNPPTRGGHGIALHSTMMAVIGGEWLSESAPGGGTRVTLTIP